MANGRINVSNTGGIKLNTDTAMEIYTNDDALTVGDVAYLDMRYASYYGTFHNTAYADSSLGLSNENIILDNGIACTGYVSIPNSYTPTITCNYMYPGTNKYGNGISIEINSNGLSYSAVSLIKTGSNTLTAFYISSSNKVYASNITINVVVGTSSQTITYTKDDSILVSSQGTSTSVVNSPLFKLTNIVDNTYALLYNYGKNTSSTYMYIYTFTIDEDGKSILEKSFLSSRQCNGAVVFSICNLGSNVYATYTSDNNYIKTVTVYYLSGTTYKSTSKACESYLSATTGTLTMMYANNIIYVIENYATNNNQIAETTYQIPIDMATYTLGTLTQTISYGLGYYSDLFSFSNYYINIGYPQNGYISTSSTTQSSVVGRIRMVKIFKYENGNINLLSEGLYPYCYNDSTNFMCNGHSYQVRTTALNTKLGIFSFDFASINSSTSFATIGYSTFHAISKSSIILDGTRYIKLGIVTSIKDNVATVSLG